MKKANVNEIATTGSNANLMIKLDVVDAISEGIPNITLQATKNQLKMISDTRNKIAQTVGVLEAKKNAIKKKTQKLNELKKQLNFNEDKKYIRDLTKIQKILATRYNAVLEAILLDFEPETEFSDKIEKLIYLSGEVNGK